MTDCPCLSNQTYAACCEPFHEGKVKARTAEQLMRARYSAFAKQRTDYVRATVLPNQRKDIDAEQLEAWSKQSKWLGFEVRTKEAGGEKDHEGMVEFVANYEVGGHAVRHHEFAKFVREEGEWFFDPKNSWEAPPEPLKVKNTAGRNDPCPCGSGKKFKKCCAAA